VRPLKVGLLPVPIDCGRLKVMLLVPLVTTTWLAVPVRVPSAGAAAVAPISNWPSVGAPVLVITFEAFAYTMPWAVRPLSVILAKVGELVVLMLCGKLSVIVPAPLVTIT